MRRDAAIVFLLRFVKLAFAILNLSLSAKYFGISLDRDVWLIALNSIVILNLAFWGPINETFRAKFLFLREEKGEEEALLKTRALFLFISIVTSLIVLILIIYPYIIANILAPKYEGKQKDSLAAMIQILAPSLLINQINKLFASILNSYNSFVLPEISGVISQGITLVLILTLAPSIGVLALVISHYCGLGLLFLILLNQIKRLEIEFLKNLTKTPLTKAKDFVIFSLPFFFPYFAGQLNLVIEKALATSLAIGTVSIIDYARKFSDIPLEVLISIVVGLLVPILSGRFVKKDKEGFMDEFRKSYQMGILIVTCVVAMLSSCPTAFVNFLYSNSGISLSSLNQISYLTMFYGWSVISVFLYQVFGAALLASKRGKFYAIYGVIAQFVMILINLLSYKWLGVYVFPFSLLISHLVSAILMYRKIPFYGRRLNVSIAKYGIVMLGVILTMFLLNRILFTISNEMILIGFNVLMLVFLLNVCMLVFKLEERLLLINWFKKLRFRS